MHYALLDTAGGENHSREANARNLSCDTISVHRWPCALVGLWTSADQLASHARQRGNTCVFARYFSSESALPLIVAELRLRQHNAHDLVLVLWRNDFLDEDLLRVDRYP